MNFYTVLAAFLIPVSQLPPVILSRCASGLYHITILIVTGWWCHHSNWRAQRLGGCLRLITLWESLMVRCGEKILLVILILRVCLNLFLKFQQVAFQLTFSWYIEKAAICLHSKACVGLFMGVTVLWSCYKTDKQDVFTLFYYLRVLPSPQRLICCRCLWEMWIPLNQSSLAWKQQAMHLVMGASASSTASLLAYRQWVK